MYVQDLRQEEFLQGNSPDLPLDAVKANTLRRPNGLYALQIKITLDITSAAVSDAISQAQYAAVANQFQLFDVNGDNFFDQPISGPALKEFERWMGFKGPTEPAAIAANSNQTNLRTLYITVPFVFPHLADPKIAMPPSAFLKRLQFTWAQANVFGTGQTVEVATRMTVLAVHLPQTTLKSRARLAYTSFTPNTHNQGRTPLNGRVLMLAVADPFGGAVTRIAADDFTFYQIQGTHTDTRQEDIDSVADLWNGLISREGDADDAQADLPSSGNARSFLLIPPYKNQKLTDAPFEREPAITLIEGAGNPAEGDQKQIAIVVRQRDDIGFARAIGNSRDFEGDPDGIEKAIVASRFVEGMRGMIADDGTNPITPFLPKPVMFGVVRKQ